MIKAPPPPYDGTAPGAVPVTFYASRPGYAAIGVVSGFSVVAASLTACVELVRTADGVVFNRLAPNPASGSIVAPGLMAVPNGYHLRVTGDVGGACHAVFTPFLPSLP